MKRNIFLVILTLLVIALVLPTACAKAEFKLNSLEINPSRVAIGDTATVKVDLTNFGGAEGTYGATLAIDGVPVETKDITVPAKSVQEFTFTVVKQAVGAYQVQVGDLVGTLHVDFQLSSLEISPKTVGPGETATVKIDLTNAGEVEGTYGIALVIDDLPMETKDITVPAKTTQEVTFTVSKQAVGVYKVQVGDLRGTLDVVKSAEFQLSSLVVTPDEIALGDEVTARVDVCNTGNSKGNYSCALLIDGVTIEKREVTLDSGQTKTIRFSFSPEEHGSCQVMVGDLTQTIEVLKSAEFTMSSLVISPDETSVGSSVTVSVDVTNLGEAEGKHTLELLVNGEISDSKTVTLGSGEKKTVRFTLVEDSIGVFNIKVNTLSGTLKVSSYEDDFSDPDSGWPIFHQEEYDCGYEGGEYSVLIKKYHWWVWVYNEQLGQIEDFSFEVDAATDKYSECDYGIVFRAQSTEKYNFYCFMIQKTGVYLIAKKIDGRWVYLSSWESTGHIKKGGGTNRLKVVCEGSQIELYVNGQLLSTFNDDTFARGYVGLIVEARESESRVVFDNIKVSLLE